MESQDNCYEVSDNTQEYQMISSGDKEIVECLSLLPSTQLIKYNITRHLKIAANIIVDNKQAMSVYLFLEKVMTEQSRTHERNTLVYCLCGLQDCVHNFLKQSL